GQVLRTSVIHHDACARGAEQTRRRGSDAAAGTRHDHDIFHASLPRIAKRRRHYCFSIPKLLIMPAHRTSSLRTKLSSSGSVIVVGSCPMARSFSRVSLELETIFVIAAFQRSRIGRGVFDGANRRTDVSVTTEG